MIDRINQLPHDRLRFRDFSTLKSGRDQYSRLTLDDLWMQIGPDELDLIEAELVDHRLIASAIRWCLRGLKVSKAIRKVKVDAEITANAIEARL